MTGTVETSAATVASTVALSPSNPTEAIVAVLAGAIASALVRVATYVIATWGERRAERIAREEWGYVPARDRRTGKVLPGQVPRRKATSRRKP